MRIRGTWLVAVTRAASCYQPMQLLAMAGPATNLVQIFRTGRAVYLEFLRLWTGFELPSSWSNLPCLWLKSESKYFRFYEVASN
jgi:hypothetical protein